MHQDNVTMLILSCDGFSDLWNGHVKMLEANWPDRGMETCIVSEEHSTPSFSNVRIIPAGKEKEWSERLKYAVEQVDTDYVFITLDDYFLIEKVDNKKIDYLLQMMEKENVDYIRLFPRPKRATQEAFKHYENVYRIDTSQVYSVNLYSGIWRRKFLLNAIQEPKNAWQFEVSLAKAARDYQALCVVSNNRDFIILDVVRKGKLLHKAARYFRRHPGIYAGTREVNSRRYEFQLWVRTMIGRHAPRFIYRALRSFMISLGFHFYSQDAEE